MKKKQTLAVLLAAAMVLSMPVGAYAEELDGEENSAGLVEPYVVDVTAPTINRISADKTELKAGETTKIRIEADDDVSGIRTFIASFQKEGTEDYISTAFSLNENPCEAELELSPAFNSVLSIEILLIVGGIISCLPSLVTTSVSELGRASGPPSVGYWL